MISRLRLKLVLASMLSLLVVLTSIIAALNIAVYVNIVDSADKTLLLLQENGGRFPEDKRRPPDRDPQGEKPKEGLLRLPFSSPELPFTTRYFSVKMDGKEILSLDIDKIAAVDEGAAGEYAAEVLRKGKGEGFIGDYRYLLFKEEDGASSILFLDCQRNMESFRRMRLYSISVSSLGFAAVFLLVALLSGRIVKPVAENYRKQRRFISDAGHELRTPLTIIEADAEILEMEQGESEWIADIRSQTARLSDLTDKLVFLSRMEENSAPELIDFMISDVVAETASSFLSLAKTRGRELILDVQPMISCRGDAKMISQLVSILLDNALKYSTADRPIRLRLERHGRGAQLMVENSVESMDAQMLDSMFDRFYRGDPSRSSEIKGYGMGLSIAHAIAGAHRAKIFASSPEDKLLRITLQLPG